MESVPLFLDDNGVVFYEPFLMCDEKSRERQFDAPTFYGMIHFFFLIAAPDPCFWKF